MGTRSRGRTLVAAAAIAVGLSVGAAAAPPPQRVTVQTFQFKPTPIEVPAGSKVTFTNQDDITHSVTSGTPENRDGKFSHQLVGKGAARAPAPRSGATPRGGRAPSPRRPF